jgi:hypothetical protein
MNYLIAIFGILFLLAGWLLVQTITRLYAQRHPEFGPVREDGNGCGESCGCAGKCTAKSADRTNRFSNSITSHFAVAKHPLGGHRD